MSWVDNAMLFFGNGELERERMAEVNSYLHEHDTRHQQFGDADSGDDCWYGGSKGLEAPLYGAAFNHVTPAVIAEAIRSAKWRHPERVILMWNGQEDAEWRPIYVMRDDIFSRTAHWSHP